MELKQVCNSRVGKVTILVNKSKSFLFVIFAFENHVKNLYIKFLEQTIQRIDHPNSDQEFTELTPC